jgi:hypothetical protein
MIDNKDGHIPSQLIMYTCTPLSHPLLEWQRHKSVHLKAAKSKLKADRPDRSNHYNFKNDDGKIASCSALTGHKLLTSPSVADRYMFLMNTWNALQESYHQKVYRNTSATDTCQIQQAENPTPAMVISLDAADVDNAILPAYLTSEAALEEPEIGSTNPNILINNTCLDDQPHFRMPGDIGDYKDEGDESNERDAIPTDSRQ